LTVLKHFMTFPLLYDGDCKLLGVTVDGLIYIEELYGDEDWLAQHKITIDDGIIDSIDELAGENLDITPFELPSTAILPTSKSCCDSLTFTGARLRGLQRDEPIAEIVLPLSVEDKIELVDYMEWDISPMQIIGIAESVVLSHTSLSDGSLMVCRRVRIAYRLTQVSADRGVPYDYDSLDLHLLHEFDPNSDDELPEVVDCLNELEDVVLLRPMDCLYHDGKLYVADGGEADDVSAIHIFDYEEKSENE
jgi:hypothetical protein